MSQVIPEKPWEHGLQSKAEGYLRDRAARKEQQQHQVLKLGAVVIFIGVTAYFTLFRLQSTLWPLLVAGCVVQLGMCLILVTDRDVNEALVFYPWLLPAIAVGGLFVKTALLLLASSDTHMSSFRYADVGSFPVIIYVCWHAPQMVEQHPQRPLPSEVAALWLTGASLSYTVVVALTLSGAVAMPDGMSRGAVIMPFSVCAPMVVFWLWLLTARTRLVRHTGSLGYCARAAASIGPTARCLASMGAAILFATTRTQARVLFPKEPEPGWSRTQGMVVVAVVWHLLAVLCVAPAATAAARQLLTPCTLCLPAFFFFRAGRCWWHGVGVRRCSAHWRSCSSLRIGCRMVCSSLRCWRASRCALAASIGCARSRRRCSATETLRCCGRRNPGGTAAS